MSPISGAPYRSTIYNSFWAAEGRAGLTPMMLAMGATALAFTPSRRAVIGEGPSEAILLPSLLREALPTEQQDEPLGYQVAPGISEVPAQEAADLEMEAGGVAYLIDADDGGRKHRRKLPALAKEQGRVVVLSSEDGASIEDFVAPQVLAAAVNRQMHRRGRGEAQVSADDLPAVGRASYLAAWCQGHGVRLNKAALAQDSLDIGRDEEGLTDPARRGQLRELHAKLLKATGTAASSEDV